MNIFHSKGTRSYAAQILKKSKIKNQKSKIKIIGLK
jgi:hypothetical protein